MFGPNPEAKEPVKNASRVGFLKNFINSENIIVGDYTYYDDPNGSENFENNVLYLFPFIGDKLIIGKFCAIASNVKFIMNGATNFQAFLLTLFRYSAMDGKRLLPKATISHFKGNTEIGNDVWIGYDSTIMPGIKIGHGAIIASKSVVIKDVPPYNVFGGNPAQHIKLRFEQAIIDELLKLAWWNWSSEKISKNIEAISGSDLNNLRNPL